MAKGQNIYTRVRRVEVFEPLCGEPAVQQANNTIIAAIVLQFFLRHLATSTFRDNFFWLWSGSFIADI